MKITKNQLRSIVLEEVKKINKKESLLEEKKILEEKISLLNEFDSDDDYESKDEVVVDEVVSGDNNKPEFKMKGTHLVEDEIETDEIWTKMEENWDQLEEEWGEPKPSEDINSNELEVVDDEKLFSEPKPSEDIEKAKNITKDLSEKMSEEDAKEIEESLKEQEALNEAMIKRKTLAGLI